MTGDKQHENPSDNGPSWSVPRRTYRSWVASLVTVFLLVTCHLSLATVSALAQSQTTGRIAGTIKDPNSAIIVGAEVTVKSLATSAERKVTTDEAGTYSTPSLPPGTYRVIVTANGFKKYEIESVRVVITETLRLDFDLEVGTINEQAVISASAPLSQTNGPQLGRVVDSRAVAELPLATRNFLQMLALSPGTFVDLPDNTALGRNSQNVSVNGARRTQNNFEINGVDANVLSQNNASGVAVPAPETIQEFKVQTSLYDSTFGRGAGGSVQAVTRSGTNDVHGSLYGYFRSDALNANNPFLKAVGVQRPVLKRNVFGGLVGGPIKRDRLFFFGSYQGTRERNGASDDSLTSSILIAPGLTDDRSEQTLLTTFRPRLPNRVPATSIHPVALALLNIKLPGSGYLIPTPQSDGRYSGSAISTYREDQFNANVDYRAGEKDWLAVKFFFSNAPQFVALPANVNAPGFGADMKQNNRLFSVQNIYTFSARTINEARIGYSFIRVDSFGRNPVKDSDIGINRANAGAYPGLGLIRIGAGEPLTIGNSGNFIDVQVNNSATTLVDILSITRGRHSIRTGGQVIYYRTNVTSNNNRRGVIVFQNFSSFLLGQATSSLNAEGITTRFLRAADYSLFLQDDWKFSERLTVNLGLRYELNLPPYETRGVLGTFDPALYQPRMEVDASGNPVGPPIGGLVQAGNVIPQYDLADVPNVAKRVLTSVDPNNIGPRGGLAYSPFDSGRLVIRGGYGIFYSRLSAVYLINTINGPPNYAIRRSPPGTLVPLEDPFIPLPSQEQFPTVVPGIALSSQTFDRLMRTAYFHQYNASLQYALSHDLLLEVAYVGTRGHNLLRVVRTNQARLASAQRPIVNQVTGQVITINTPTNATLRAPYQGADIAGLAQRYSTAESAYNSVQISLTRRLSKGLQLLASYTHAKSLDNASGGDSTDGSGIFGNQLDPRANRGVSDFDRTHRFVVSYLWDLPKPAFASRSRAGRQLLSGWQVAGIFTAMSGQPFDIVDSAAGSFYFGANSGLSRPSWAPGATRETATNNVPPGYFFNPFAFVRPVVQTGHLIPSSNGLALAGTQGTDIGNVGRNVLRGPRQINVDFSVIRRFPFGEARSVEFRAEFFNLFNQVNFDNPNTDLNSATVNPVTGQIINPGDFGRITATSNNPRLIQLALKFNF
ncbi:MAG TPA: carboxypeptidase regulatory-like domain-containing protein [Pyrinomonadaceae bacterium]|nr:carboxypeptidase regulatory-like domain-containing protein [Pyrinomonadaceae bacterium]